MSIITTKKLRSIDKDDMLLTAMRLSGAPFSFVEMVYEKEAA